MKIIFQSQTKFLICRSLKKTLTPGSSYGKLDPRMWKVGFKQIKRCLLAW